ncbi:MAG: hypothetical protein COX41_00420, partial [Candidatus Omnitrophica bacterium CG23_combo_of_CG06-09_8_20_14_all_41_10]
MNANGNNFNQKSVECTHSVSREIYKYYNKPIYKCDSCGLFFNQRLNNGFKSRVLYRSSLFSPVKVNMKHRFVTHNF